MPIVLQPLPRRHRRTRDEFLLTGPVRLSISPDQPPVAAELQRILEVLIQVPEVQPPGASEPAMREVRFLTLSESEAISESIPADLVTEAYRLSVGPDEIEVSGGSAIAWLWAARHLHGLREGNALRGIQLVDWPSFRVRRIELGWPASTISTGSLGILLRLLAIGRMNELGLPDGAALLSGESQDMATRLGIRIVACGNEPAYFLLDPAGLFLHYSERLPALQAKAICAEAEGRSEFAVSLGEPGGQTSLESLAYGILFAGDCAWNARKADRKAFRRTFALRRFGFDSRAPLQVVDTLEQGAALAGGMDVADLANPFDSVTAAAAAQPKEQADRIEQAAASALAAMAAIQPDTDERAVALQGLQWTAQRLKRLGGLLGLAQRVRSLYRSAYLATASPKAVSDRLLRAADLMEREARELDEHRGEWHALWRRERQGPYDPETEARLRAPGDTLLARAARLRELRNRYIQTGALPSPAEEGLERVEAHLTAGLVPARLPPQPSPAWWPEGGAARMQLEVDCPEPAAGIPWAVQADFRTLAGEAGAFNVRSARVIPLTEEDASGPEQPCQLLRSGFAFIPEAGRRSYFLYLDPEPGPDSGYREVRASQSRNGVRLENTRMRVTLSAASPHFLSGWQLLVPPRELLVEEHNPASAGEAAWRLRVIETGPLLARARFEHWDGRIRQFDLVAGQTWIDVSVNTSGEDVVLRLSEGLWAGGAGQVLGTDEGIEQRALDASHPVLVRWAGLHAADGLTVGLALPESTADVALSTNRVAVHEPPGGHCLVFAGTETGAGGETLIRLVGAWRRPPQVRLGIFEHRRVREF
jgi:hypothetical protein